MQVIRDPLMIFVKFTMLRKKTGQHTQILMAYYRVAETKLQEKIFFKTCKTIEEYLK